MTASAAMSSPTLSAAHASPNARRFATDGGSGTAAWWRWIRGSSRSRMQRGESLAAGGHDRVELDLLRAQVRQTSLAIAELGGLRRRDRAPRRRSRGWRRPRRRAWAGRPTGRRPRRHLVPFPGHLRQSRLEGRRSPATAARPCRGRRTRAGRATTGGRCRSACTSVRPGRARRRTGRPCRAPTGPGSERPSRPRR